MVVHVTPTAALTTGNLDWAIFTGPDATTPTLVASGSHAAPGPGTTTINLGPWTGQQYWQAVFTNSLSNPITVLAARLQ